MEDKKKPASIFSAEDDLLIIQAVNACSYPKVLYKDIPSVADLIVLTDLFFERGILAKVKKTRQGKRGIVSANNHLRRRALAFAIHYLCKQGHSIVKV